MDITARPGMVRLTLSNFTVFLCFWSYWAWKGLALLEFELTPEFYELFRGAMQKMAEQTAHVSDSKGFAPFGFAFPW